MKPLISPSGFADSSAQLLSSHAASASVTKDANFRAVAWAILFFNYTSPDTSHSRYRLSSIFEREKAVAPSMVKMVIQVASVAVRSPEIRSLIEGEDPIADFNRLVDHFSNRFPSIKSAIGHFKTGTGTGGPTPMPTSQWLASAMESWTRRSRDDLEKLQTFLAAEINRRKT